MSEHQSEQEAETIAAADAEKAALPLIESPTISPETAVEAGPVEAAPIEIVPVATTLADIPSVDVASVEASATPPAVPNATQRFRAMAAAQIAAARSRLEQRKMSSVMAVAVMASLAGGFGTVLATSAIAHFAAAAEKPVAPDKTLTEALTRIEDQMTALRGQLDRAAEIHATQTDNTVERLDRIERAQAEPAAKLAKLTELVEKLRFANVAQASQAANTASSDITGSVKPAPTGFSGGKSKRTIVEGWTLREVDRDAALIEGKRGLYETYVGDTIPGVGRVEGFRKQDGQWVIVTAKGLIVSR